MRLNNRMFALKLFILIWVLSLLTLKILPIKSKIGDEFDAFTLIIAFVLIISLTAIGWYILTRNIRIPNWGKNEISREKIIFIINWSSFSTIVGNILLYIDRTLFRGIDYSKGFRAARMQWKASTISGGVFSILGNLMIPFSYCALFMGIFHWEILSKRQRVLALISGLGGQLCISMLNGGRSNILLSLAFAFVVCVLRKYNGKSFTPKFQGRIFVILGVSAVLLYYVHAILYWIADNNLRTLHLMADMLGAKVESDYSGSPIINMVTEIALYILHGIYFVSAVIENNPSFADIADMDHNMTFRWIWFMLARSHLLYGYTMKLPEFDGGGGNFIALPGILLYDYGYIGFFIGCITFGVLFGRVLRFLNTSRNNDGMVDLLITVFVLLHLYMSMITMALNFGYFMFMMYAMGTMELIARVKFGGSGWMNLKGEA